MGLGALYYGLSGISGLLQGAAQGYQTERQTQVAKDTAAALHNSKMEEQAALQKMRMEEQDRLNTMSVGDVYRAVQLVDPAGAEQFRTTYDITDPTQRMHNSLVSVLMKKHDEQRQRNEALQRAGVIGRQMEEMGAPTSGRPEEYLGLGTEQDSGDIYDLSKPGVEAQPGNPTLQKLGKLWPSIAMTDKTGEKSMELVAKILGPGAIQHLKIGNPEVGEGAVGVDESGRKVYDTPISPGTGNPVKPKSIQEDPINGTYDADNEFPQATQDRYGRTRWINKTRPVAILPQNSNFVDTMAARKAAAGQPGGAPEGGLIGKGQESPASPDVARTSAQAGVMRASAESMKAMLSDPRLAPDITANMGPAAQYKATVQRWTPGGLAGTPPKAFTDFETKFITLRNYLTRLEAGLAQTGTETANVREQLPSFLLGPREFMQKLEIALEIGQAYEDTLYNLSLRDDQKGRQARFTMSTMGLKGPGQPGREAFPGQSSGVGRQGTVQELEAAKQQAGGDAMKTREILRSQGIDTSLPPR